MLYSQPKGLRTKSFGLINLEYKYLHTRHLTRDTQAQHLLVWMSLYYNLQQSRQLSFPTNK